MKCVHRISAFVIAGVLVLSAGSAFATQYTTTCPSGQWDMLSMFFMQQSYLADNYYVKGNSYTWQNGQWVKGGTVLHSDVIQIATQHNGIWDTGKYDSVKDYQAEPGFSAPPFWAYPWDINLFDDNYVYLWITENLWTDPWSYKEFTNSSTPYSMLFTRRCAVPGDNGTTSQLVNDPKGGGTYTTEFYIVPTTPKTVPGDCTAAYTDDQLGYAIMNVLAPESNAFTLTNNVGGGNISLDLVPVTYRYNCSSGTGNGGCKSKEEFDFGYDSSQNHYGLVQWTLSSSPDGNTWTNVQQSRFNNLDQWTATQIQQGEGGTDVSFPCTPYN